MALHTSKNETSTSRVAFGFNDDPNTGVLSTAADTISIVAGGVECAVYSSTKKGAYVLKIPITGYTSTGVKVATANPQGASMLIMNRWLNVTTQSSGACTLDIGVAADGSTSSDTLLDGLSVASAGLLTTNGTNGLPSRTWSSTQYVNVAGASGDMTGLVADLYLEIVLL